jgi:hypothetical protein
MSKLEPHPLSKMFPPILQEDFDKLAKDIEIHGLNQPIVTYQGMILDGNHRYRACELAKVEPHFFPFEGTDAQARNYVISANIHRRHLSPDQRRAIIETLLKADPSQSNRQIGEQTKTSHHTVEAVRTEMEATGQIAQLDETTGADGKSRKRKSKGNATPKSASDKYDVAQEKLIVLLQDLDVDAADAAAETTTKELRKTVATMKAGAKSKAA